MDDLSTDWGHSHVHNDSDGELRNIESCAGESNAGTKERVKNCSVSIKCFPRGGISTACVYRASLKQISCVDRFRAGLALACVDRVQPCMRMRGPAGPEAKVNVVVKLGIGPKVGHPKIVYQIP